jgi:hypothetical protein
MNHHEQHHQHHDKEREKRIEHQKEAERRAEKSPGGKIHPGWFAVLGTILVLLVVLVWVLLVP